MGNVVTQDGNDAQELFVVDIPDEVTNANLGPLSGTEHTRPAPPKGTVQRRLTHTTERKKPGISTTVRHWPRISHDGSMFAFLMNDDSGQTQFWTMSPNGNPMCQLSDLFYSKVLIPGQ